MFYLKYLDLNIKAFFLNPEGKLIGLDVNSSDDDAFSLLAACAPIEVGLISSRV